MSRPQKTQAQQQLERERKAERERAKKRRESEAEGRARDLFLAKLADLKSLSAALAFAHTPLPNNPGRDQAERKYYDNFADFLGSLSPQGCTVPPDSTLAERSEYLHFIERIEAAGEKKPGEVEEIKRALRNSGAA